MRARIFALTFAALLATPLAGPAAAADVGVSIGVNSPGVFGRIDIGGYPAPQTIYAQPRVIERAPQYASQPPLYLHVPPGHAKRWSRYCRQYDACGQPVYFVRDDWYQNVYTPRYREVHGRHDDRGRGNDRGRDERGEDDRGRDDRGDRHDNRGNDRGRGH